jgi:hypothetical protein
MNFLTEKTIEWNDEVIEKFDSVTMIFMTFSTSAVYISILTFGSRLL